MRKKSIQMKSTISLTIFALLLAALSTFLFSGCTETLQGDVVANQKPIVYFVNIPPEGQKFSRNPVVHWVGTDRDGQIDFFRYHVVRIAQMGGAAPEDYIQTVPDVDWIKLDVDHKKAEPRTTNTIAMSADLSDPVNTFIDQYIFLQAFDEGGLGSEIIFRLFSRNDNPPQTVIFGITLDSPFVNSVMPGGIITGIKLRWGGSDPIDYPSDPPPFQYDWKLFGPYNKTEFALIDTFFIRPVYVTSDARIFELGDSIFNCDTTFVADSVAIVCDTIIVDEDTETSASGGLETSFAYNDPDFPDSLYARLAASSGIGYEPGWVNSTADTIYDVYTDYYNTPAGANIDTTVEMYYVFSVRSRDDALVADLVPAFRTFTVIDARKERAVAVVDYNQPIDAFATINWTNYKSTTLSKTYWSNLLVNWRHTTNIPLPNDTVPDAQWFDTTIIPVTIAPPGYRRQSPDYMRTTYADNGLRLVELLKHKIVIIYHDDVRDPNFMNKSGALFTAIDAGVNVWVTARNMLEPLWQQCDLFQNEIIPPFNFQRYFGVQSTVMSGWAGNLAFPDCQYSGYNIADFIGGYSIDPSVWPEIFVDSAALHSSYWWQNNFVFPDPLDLWNPDLPALPEVNWLSRGFGTEVMYLYRSGYGATHPIGSELSFDGAPVAHRYPTSLYRTVYFNFTPLGMQADSMQKLANNVLDWLYPTSAAAVSAMPNNYKDAKVKISLEDARANFIRHRTESILLNDPDAFDALNENRK